MSKSKLLGIIVLSLIALIVVFNFPFKKKATSTPLVSQSEKVIIPEVVKIEPSPLIEKKEIEKEAFFQPIVENILPKEKDLLPLLFQPYPPNLPIVETVSFSTKTPWISGRSSYLGDYASHYHTSKHFISRSLHGVGNYLSDKVAKGDRFNVYRLDKEIEFHLVADLSKLKMRLYYFDKTENERVLLKTYPISAGKRDCTSTSGFLTPCGVFSIGQEVAVYSEGSMGTFRGKPCEMVTVFGKRWLPLSREIHHATGTCKGLGIHGLPWKHEEKGELIECREGIGHYESEGCLRLLSEDIAEIFSVVVARPSFLHIVPEFAQAQLPGVEKEF